MLRFARSLDFFGVRADHDSPSIYAIVGLLVVISIVALRIAVLLPAFGTARKSARNIQCISNQKQLVLAWTSYAVENKDAPLPTHMGQFL